MHPYKRRTGAQHGYSYVNIAIVPEYCTVSLWLICPSRDPHSTFAMTYSRVPGYLKACGAVVAHLPESRRLRFGVGLGAVAARSLAQVVGRFRLCRAELIAHLFLASCPRRPMCHETRRAGVWITARHPGGRSRVAGAGVVGLRGRCIPQCLVTRGSADAGAGPGRGGGRETSGEPWRLWGRVPSWSPPPGSESRSGRPLRGRAAGVWWWDPGRVITSAGRRWSAGFPACRRLAGAELVGARIVCRWLRCALLPALVLLRLLGARALGPRF